ncbi:MAG: ComEC/Rec2 family competence protein [Candidatus Blackburnbacteria bacterium]|nr:ComEC/Rec2 family competence protein [Candidatus Blackburnbacteria bacterium]
MKLLFAYILIPASFLGIYLFRLNSVRYTLHQGDRVQITGTISDQPKIYRNQQGIIVGEFSFFVSAGQDLQYGDKVQVVGTAKSSGRYWNIEEPVVEKINTSQSLVVAYILRERIASFYNKVLPVKHAALLSGIVLGTKSSLDFSFFDALRNTGTLHVVVASGTNISLFAGSVLSILAGWLKRRWAIAVTVVLVWLYILVIGWQPPIVRAGAMASVAFLAQGTGREGSSIRALVLTAVLMLFVQPLWLFDLGFQLSFLATAGVILLGGRIVEKIGEVRGIRGLPKVIQSDLGTSLGAQIAVDPLIFWKFGSISWSAPLVNPLVLWTIPPIMAGGMVLGVIGGISEVGKIGVMGGLGRILAWFLWLPLEYFIRIVELFG